MRQGAAAEDRVLMLHMRMGHPPFELLNTFYPSMFGGIEVSKLFCEACQLAKHKRSSFKSLNDRCLSPFECIHSDVWGHVSFLVSLDARGLLSLWMIAHGLHGCIY